MAALASSELSIHFSFSGLGGSFGSTFTSVKFTVEV
jgi:hypothetical protein